MSFTSAVGSLHSWQATYYFLKCKDYIYSSKDTLSLFWLWELGFFQMIIKVKGQNHLPYIMAEPTQKSLNQSNLLTEKKKKQNLKGKLENVFIKPWLDSFTFQLTFIYNICPFIYVWQQENYTKTSQNPAAMCALWSWKVCHGVERLLMPQLICALGEGGYHRAVIPQIDSDYWVQPPCPQFGETCTVLMNLLGHWHQGISQWGMILSSAILLSETGHKVDTCSKSRCHGLVMCRWSL